MLLEQSRSCWPLCSRAFFRSRFDQRLPVTFELRKLTNFENAGNFHRFKLHSRNSDYLHFKQTTSYLCFKTSFQKDTGYPGTVGIPTPGTIPGYPGTPGTPGRNSYAAEMLTSNSMWFVHGVPAVQLRCTSSNLKICSTPAPCYAPVPGYY
eukprot:1809117-Rhodomonas_salina.2